MTTFRYCTFRYAGDGLQWRNIGTATEPTQTLVDHCIFENIGGSGMYGTSGCVPTITHCVFGGGIGIFMHGTGPVTIHDTYIHDVSCGIINAGLTGYNQQSMNIDHVTIYNVAMALTGTPQWWTGYGIYCANNAGSMTVTNSIVDRCDLFALKRGSWTVTEDYNCWHTDVGGFEDGTPGAHSLDGSDPLLAAPANGNYRLQAGSPCLSSGSDGTNRGAWQSADTWPAMTIAVHDHYQPAAANKLPLLPNPCRAAIVCAARQRTEFAVRGLDGKPWAGTPGVVLVTDRQSQVSRLVVITE
jgi:hypothetical protein